MGDLSLLMIIPYVCIHFKLTKRLHLLPPTGPWRKAVQAGLSEGWEVRCPAGPTARREHSWELIADSRAQLRCGFQTPGPSGNVSWGQSNKHVDLVQAAYCAPTNTQERSDDRTYTDQTLSQRGGPGTLVKCFGHDLI